MTFCVKKGKNTKFDVSIMLFDDEQNNYERPEYSRPTSNAVKTMMFVMIGSVLIVFTDLVILDEFQLFRNGNSIESSLLDNSSSVDLSLEDRHARYLAEGIALPKEYARAKTPKIIFPDPDALNAIEPALGSPEDIIELDEPDVILDRKNIDDVLSALETPKAVSKPKETAIISKPDIEFYSPDSNGKPKIAIIIDDMGLTLRSKILEVMKGPLTLSYLPYADNLSDRTARAKAHGHELMVHLPMEPMNKNVDGGPRVLSSDLTSAELRETLEWGLSQFSGYEGVNNHMGSRFTQDEDALGHIMDVLADRDLYFIDSKTIASSVAADVARHYGLAHAVRDVFLDHEISEEFIESALAKLERVARDKGHAVAIGHPHKETIDALKAWIPTLKEKGFELVPASEIVSRPVREEAVAIR